MILLFELVVVFFSAFFVGLVLAFLVSSSVLARRAFKQSMKAE